MHPLFIRGARELSTNMRRDSFAKGGIPSPKTGRSNGRSTSSSGSTPHQQKEATTSQPAPDPSSSSSSAVVSHEVEPNNLDVVSHEVEPNNLDEDVEEDAAPLFHIVDYRTDDVSPPQQVGRDPLVMPLRLPPPIGFGNCNTGMESRNYVMDQYLSLGFSTLYDNDASVIDHYASNFTSAPSKFLQYCDEDYIIFVDYH